MSNTTKRFLMAASGAGGATYVDDVFSTYPYKGNETARTLATGVDNTKGGMVWVKNRDNSAFPPYLYDTERGVNKQLRTSSSAAETTGSNTLTSFNNDGITIGNDTMINRNGDNHVAWNFRKAEGFFDIVTYTGNGANRTIAHSLGCIPGSIWIKQLNGAGEWINYHCGIGAEKFLQLNNTEPKNDDASVFQDTEPTASVFSLGTHAYVNGNGNTYIAYLFAGNLSDSVHFDGSGDTIHSGTGNAFTHGTNDFTIECWAKFEDTADRGVYQHNSLMTQNWSNYPAVGHNGTNWVVYGAGGTAIHQGGGARTVGQWYHLAHVRHSGTTKLYVDGVEKISFTDTYSYGTNRILIGGYYDSGHLMKGNVTNWRLVKGRALYTSNFTPPTTPLGKTYASDGTMDTFFLCCNTGNPAGYTIDDTGNGMSIKSGDPQQSSDVPSTFGELTALFGEDEDKSIIKCGSYVGKSGANTVNLGWEPQWVIVKNVDSVEPWVMVDNMRGWVNASSGVLSLKASSTSNESAYNYWGPTATGWEDDLNNREIDMNEQNYIYIALRRPDGYVGKPPEAGTDVFNVVYGNSSSIIPNFTSTFPVDFGIYKEPANNYSWYLHTRLTGNYAIRTNDANAQGGSDTDATFDSPTGWGKFGYNTDKASWMWKRHAGFDVVTYNGNSNAGSQISHGLSKVPEMMWIKRRNDFEQWFCWHNGLNGGTNPEQYSLEFNNQGEASISYLNNTAPTATNFTVGSHGMVNQTSGKYTAFLFASVEGISKCGYYDGSNSPLTITTGFQPRFFVVKRYDAGGNWTVFDTLRGWGSGNDCKFEFNTSGPQNCNTDFGYPTSTGIYLTNDPDTNLSGYKFIYYAHA